MNLIQLFFSLLFKNHVYLIDQTSQEINQKKLQESLIVHISCTKILCPTCFILPTTCSHSKPYDFYLLFDDHKHLAFHHRLI